MKLLVTGGMGFIGSNFIRHMLNNYPKLQIVNLDKLTYAGNPNNLLDLKGNKRHAFVKGDICNRKIVERAMKGCDTVVNFAAETHVDRSITDPYSFINTDVFGTYTLADVAAKQKIRKFVHISTDEVYGSREKGSFSEEDKLEPSSPYSASKASGDMIVNSYIVTKNLQASIVRPSNNFGPYQYPEKIMPLFITNLLQGKKVPLYGDGKNVRDWLFVIDNCRAIEKVLFKGNVGKIYNIAGGNEIQNVKLTKMILDGLNLDDSYIQKVKDRPGHDRRYSITSGKIRKLGWKPWWKFRDALAYTIEWYAMNHLWWKPLLKG